MDNKKRILILEDDEILKNVLREFLETQGLEVFEACSINEALSYCESHSIHLLLLDYNIGYGEVGWNLIKEIAKDNGKYGNPKAIAMSGTVDLEAVKSLGFHNEKIHNFLQKPFDLEELQRVIRKLLA